MSMRLILAAVLTAFLISLSQCAKKEETFTEADALKMCTKMSECLEPHMKMMREQMNQVPPSMRGMMPKMEMPSFDKADCMKKSNVKTTRTKEGRELTQDEMKALKRCHEKIVASSCEEITTGKTMTSTECADWMKIAENLQ